MPAVPSLEDFAQRYLDPVALELGKRAEDNVLVMGISRRSRKFKGAVRAEVKRLCRGPDLLAVMKEIESRRSPEQQRLLQAIRECL